jgi:2-dehydropantoate 2-reductase
MVTTNLWGERWSKLVANAMFNGLSASTGLSTSAMLEEPAIRHFAIWLGSEAVRVGEVQGYALEEIYHMPPEVIARAGEGDAVARQAIEDRMLSGSRKRSAEQRPSMGQDMRKGRRTEIDFLNGFVVRKGEEVGIAARANAALADIVRRVERGERPPDPRHIIDLRLN